MQPTNEKRSVLENHKPVLPLGTTYFDLSDASRWTLIVLKIIFIFLAAGLSAKQLAEWLISILFWLPNFLSNLLGILIWLGVFFGIAGGLYWLSWQSIRVLRAFFPNIHPIFWLLAITPLVIVLHSSRIVWLKSVIEPTLFMAAMTVPFIFIFYIRSALFIAPRIRLLIRKGLVADATIIDCWETEWRNENEGTSGKRKYIAYIFNYVAHSDRVQTITRAEQVITHLANLHLEVGDVVEVRYLRNKPQCCLLQPYVKKFRHLMQVR